MNQLASLLSRALLARRVHLQLVIAYSTIDRGSLVHHNFHVNTFMISFIEFG
jgi:hypothetical protein